jgi:hypothetical protein
MLLRRISVGSTVVGVGVGGECGGRLMRSRPSSMPNKGGELGWVEVGGGEDQSAV